MIPCGKSAARLKWRNKAAVIKEQGGHHAERE